MKAPEKIYIPTILAANTVIYKVEGSIEYTRTDAFIEKACEWLKNSSYGYLIEKWGEIDLDREELAVDFANYMKGE